MDLLMEILGLVLKCFTAYTVLIGVLFLLPRRRYPQTSPKAHFAVLIAARNEEAVIGGTVRSLLEQNYPKELFDVIVIPNNCTDDTAGVAGAAGAKLLYCPEAVHCKGDVLHQIFPQLMGKYDAYCVFDADNLVDPDFLARMNDAIAAGAEVAKGRLVAINPYESWVAGCYELHFQNFNLLYSRPRERLGLSSKLVGTGFMVTDGLLQRLGGWNTVTLAEDAEFAAQCAEANVWVHYIHDAVSYDEQPTTLRASMLQRRRWAGGIMAVANRYVPRILSHRPTWRRLDFALFICTMYLQLLAMLPVCYRLSDMTWQSAGLVLLTSLVSFWVGMTLTALFLCVTAGRSPKKMWRTILLYPLFTASWYPLYLLGLVSKPKTWQPMVHTGQSRHQPKYSPDRS